MRLVHDIFVEQQQKLLMTPELRQAIAILHMSTMELNEFIQTELEENPFLEEREIEEAEEHTREESDDGAWLEEWLEIYHDRDIGVVQKEKKEEKKQNGWAIKDTLLDIINKLKPNKNGSQAKKEEGFSLFKSRK